MKIPRLTYLLVAILGLCSPAFLTSCKTAPSERVAVYQTLGVLGSSAKAALDSSTQLLKQGSITVAQYQKIADFYDNKWQPTYALALAAAQSNVSTVASPDVTSLALQFLALVASFMPPPNPAP